MPASLLKTKDLAALISARATEMGFSEAQLSDRVAGHPSLVSDIKRGRMPSFGRLQEIARVLDFELYFGPRRGPLNKASDHLIPHKGFARCGPDGWGRPVDRDDLPGPAELIDDQVFFVEAGRFCFGESVTNPGPRRPAVY